MNLCPHGNLDTDFCPTCCHEETEARYQSDPEGFIGALVARARDTDEYRAAEDRRKRDAVIKQASDNEVLDLLAEQAGCLSSPSEWLKRRRGGRKGMH